MDLPTIQIQGQLSMEQPALKQLNTGLIPMLLNKKNMVQDLAFRYQQTILLDTGHDSMRESISIMTNGVLSQTLM